jgi:hypothetical protein
MTKSAGVAAGLLERTDELAVSPARSRSGFVAVIARCA